MCLFCSVVHKQSFLLCSSPSHRSLFFSFMNGGSLRKHPQPTRGGTSISSAGGGARDISHFVTAVVQHSSAYYLVSPTTIPGYTTTSYDVVRTSYSSSSSCTSKDSMHLKAITRALRIYLLYIHTNVNPHPRTSYALPGTDLCVSMHHALRMIIIQVALCTAKYPRVKCNLQPTARRSP